MYYCICFNEIFPLENSFNFSLCNCIITMSFECSKREMTFQRKCVQHRKYIFVNGIRFFSLSRKHSRSDLERHERYESQKGRQRWYPINMEMSAFILCKTTGASTNLPRSFTILKPYLVPTERERDIYKTHLPAMNEVKRALD